jgi:hypothetical protein
MDIPRILDKSTSANKIGSVLLASFVLLVASIVMYQGSRPPDPLIAAKLGAWHKIQLQDVDRVVLGPLDGGRGAMTVSSPIAITNKEFVAKIWNGLHSPHRAGYYLKGVQHWEGSRYARLEIHTRSGAVTPFYVSWDDSAGACTFAIMPRPDDLDYKPIGIDKRASATLANTLDYMVASNKVSWGPCHGPWETW